MADGLKFRRRQLGFGHGKNVLLFGCFFIPQFGGIGSADCCNTKCVKQIYPLLL